MNNETIQIKKDSVLSVYQTAYETGDTDTMLALETLFGEEIFNPKDVTDRIKTFEDACRELGESHPLVCQYNTIDDVDTNLNAYLKLRIITAALNEGWEPKFTKDECRYFPWFKVYSKDELEKMDEEERSRAVGRASSYASVSGGLAFACANSASSYSYTIFGSLLAFKSEELAIYCGKQFIDLWKDYFII